MLSSLKMTRNKTVSPQDSHSAEDQSKLRRKYSSKENIAADEGTTVLGVNRATDVRLDQTPSARIKRYRPMVRDAEDRLEARKLHMPSIDAIIEDFRTKLTNPWCVNLRKSTRRASRRRRRQN